MPYMIIEVASGSERVMSSFFTKEVSMSDGVDTIRGKVIEIGQELHTQEEE